MTDPRRSRSEEWAANECEIQRLSDLPVKGLDPTVREVELERRRDEIEFEVGEEYLRRAHEQRPSLEP